MIYFLSVSGHNMRHAKVGQDDSTNACQLHKEITMKLNHKFMVLKTYMVMIFLQDLFIKPGCLLELRFLGERKRKAGIRHGREMNKDKLQFGSLTPDLPA